MAGVMVAGVMEAGMVVVVAAPEGVWACGGEAEPVQRPGRVCDEGNPGDHVPRNGRQVCRTDGSSFPLASLPLGWQPRVVTGGPTSVLYEM